MAPKSGEVPFSSLGIKEPKNIRNFMYNGFWWLKDKQDTDGAEGLWRIHDDLYDFEGFINKHPGGVEWLKFTKGTDITEAFMVHHISTAPGNLLPKFHKRKATTRRNFPFTFKEDGFYMTLKKNVREALPKLHKQVITTSEFLTDSSLVLTFLFSILAAKYWSFFLGIIAGGIMACLSIASHNFLHQKDNIRMYYFNLCGWHYKEFRISHALSHHLHTNTIDDMEVQGFEPLLQYLPRKKPKWSIYGCFIYSPLIWATVLHLAMIKRVLRYTVLKQLDTMSASDLIPLGLPIAMYIFGGQSVLNTLLMWNFIIAFGSFHFLGVGQNGAHHHPDVFHDGDAIRPPDQMDWGISQLDTIMENRNLQGSHWLILTNFGDHTLHHLFPTLDHGILNQLYPVLQETLKQFNLNMRYSDLITNIKGNFKTKMNTVPNPKPTDLFKKIQ